MSDWNTEVGTWRRTVRSWRKTAKHCETVCRTWLCVVKPESI